MWLKIMIAMFAFAANSILCRLALWGQHIDAMSFSLIRVVSGAVMLCILYGCSRTKAPIEWSVKNGVYLAVYILAFSIAYLHIDAGVGALLLFGTVQLSMLGYALWQGEKLNIKGGLGVIVALLGLSVLLLPGASTPHVGYAAMMVVSGLGWAAYSIAGKAMQNPLASTLANFVLAIPFVLITYGIFYANTFSNWIGIFLAVLSGALASSSAYVLWYLIVKKIDRITASSVQLSVPCLAIIGGNFILNEVLTVQIMLASFMVIVGIILVIN